MPALNIRFHRGGVNLPALGLWLDPHERQTGPDRCFVSHAHSDHTGLHREVILSEATSRLMRARIGGEAVEHLLPFGEARTFAGPNDNRHQVTLLPAGHIFGSAMALVESEGQSLLYTGDFKLRPSLSSETCQPRPADILIMETTFGRPDYRFPASQDVLGSVVRFCQEALDNEETPVLFGYSLGKSQEILQGLAGAQLPVVLHSSVHKLTRVFEELGQQFPPYEKLDPANARGKVLLCPPNTLTPALRKQLGKVRTAILTGWAVEPHCRYRYQVDAAFPLSDHADYPDLLEMVRLVAPKKVYTLHGFAADFAQSLRDLGYDAQSLSEEEQLALPLSFQSAGIPSSARPTAGLRRSPPVLRLSTTLTAAPSGEPVKPDAPVAVPAAAETPGAPGTATAPASAAFREFARVCAVIGSTPKKLEKVRHLAEYLTGLDTDALPRAAVWFTGAPFASSANKVLQLGWAVIRDALCTVGGLDHGAFGQVYLKHSDLGETAQEILKSLPAPTVELTVAQVNGVFEKLHEARGPLSKLPLLAETLTRCTPLEGKYLVKILTGDLRVGLKEGLVEEAIASAFACPLEEVRNANLLLANIGSTALLARRKELSGATMTPFRPVKFMLASPEHTSEDIWQRAGQWVADPPPSGTSAPLLGLAVPLPPAATVWLEDKYDGIRAQLHKVGDRVSLYSRDLKEITATFLELADEARMLSTDFVLDGEVIAERDGMVLPFVELQRRLGRREADLFLRNEIPVRFIAFDLLWHNGESLLNRPLRERRLLLESIPKLSRAQITQAASAVEVETAFLAARERGHEGLIVKDPVSPYVPGRRGLSWLKLKQAFATLDCVVVGAEYGHGRRHAVLSDYTFAVREAATGRLRVIGKAFTGLTDAEIGELTRHFLEKVVRRDGRYLEVEPDVVLEIAFDIIQPSTRHDSGLALRFPRILRVRTDKTAQNIDTLEAAWKLVKPAAG